MTLGFKSTSNIGLNEFLPTQTEPLGKGKDGEDVCLMFYCLVFKVKHKYYAFEVRPLIFYSLILK